MGLVMMLLPHWHWKLSLLAPPSPPPAPDPGISYHWSHQSHRLSLPSLCVHFRIKVLGIGASKHMSYAPVIRNSWEHVSGVFGGRRELGCYQNKPVEDCPDVRRESKCWSAKKCPPQILASRYKWHIINFDGSSMLLYW